MRVAARQAAAEDEDGFFTSLDLLARGREEEEEDGVSSAWSGTARLVSVSSDDMLRDNR